MSGGESGPFIWFLLYCLFSWPDTQNNITVGSCIGFGWGKIPCFWRLGLFNTWKLVLDWVGLSRAITPVAPTLKSKVLFMFSSDPEQSGWRVGAWISSGQDLLPDRTDWNSSGFLFLALSHPCCMALDKTLQPSNQVLYLNFLSHKMRVYDSDFWRCPVGRCTGNKQ